MSRLLTERAHSQGREIIPILTDAQVSPSSCGWLKTVCGGRGGAAWYDFGQATQQDEQLFEVQVTQLSQALGQRARRVGSPLGQSAAAASPTMSFAGGRSATELSLNLSPVPGRSGVDGSAAHTPRASGPNESFQAHQREYSQAYSTASVGFPQGSSYAGAVSDGRWDVAETSQWFRNSLPFAPQYQQAFDALGMDKNTLAMLTDDDLAEEVGVTSRLHRRAILTEIQKLQPRPTREDRQSPGGGDDSAPSRSCLASAMSFEGSLADFPPEGSAERAAFDDEFKCVSQSHSVHTHRKSSQACLCLCSGSRWRDASTSAAVGSRLAAAVSSQRTSSSRMWSPDRSSSSSMWSSRRSDRRARQRRPQFRYASTLTCRLADG